MNSHLLEGDERENGKNGISEYTFCIDLTFERVLVSCSKSKVESIRIGRKNPKTESKLKQIEPNYISNG